MFAYWANQPWTSATKVHGGPRDLHIPNNAWDMPALHPFHFRSFPARTDFLGCRQQILDHVDKFCAANLPAHKPLAIREAIEAAGAELRFLPPYSPDFNPIEMAFSKLKSFLKKTAARTREDLWDAIGQGIDRFTPTECENYFAAAGYDLK